MMQRWLSQMPSSELRRKIGTSEYERLERNSNEARVKSEQTGLALEQHIAADPVRSNPSHIRAGEPRGSFQPILDHQGLRVASFTLPAAL